MAKYTFEIPEDVIDAIRDDVIKEHRKYFAESLRNYAKRDGLIDTTTDWADVESMEPVDAFMRGYERAAAELEHPDFEF